MMSDNATVSHETEGVESPLDELTHLERRVAYLELALTHLVNELGVRHILPSDYRTRIMEDSDRALAERDEPGA